MTAPLDLDRYEGHTPGPWRAVKSLNGQQFICTLRDQWLIQTANDATLYILADAPLLLAELRQVRAERDALREAVAWIAEHASEFDGIEDSGTMVDAMSAKAIAALEVPRG
jgi:hypothetical protein